MLEAVNGSLHVVCLAALGLIVSAAMAAYILKPALDAFLRIARRSRIDALVALVMASIFIAYGGSKPAKTWTVLFNVNGGESVSFMEKSVGDGNSIGNLPDAQWAGHEFLGWFTAVSNGVEVTKSSKVTGDMTCYANWKLIEPGPGPGPDPDPDPEQASTCFASSTVVAEEGDVAVVRISGGAAGVAASVKLYLSYGSAVAADVDLKAGAIDGVTPKGGLKFPLTVSWAKNEIGEKVVAIPITKDKAVESDESFVMQLAGAQGMELGENRVCTVVVHDPGYDDLAAKIASGTASKAEIAAWNKLQAAKEAYCIRGVADTADRGKVTGGGMCAPGKKVALKAAASKGFVFTGWTAEQIPLDGGRVVAGAQEYIATTPSLVIDRSSKPAKNSATSTTIPDVAGDATYYANFVTADDDKAAIETALFVSAESAPLQLSATSPLLITNYCGVAVKLPVAVSALSATTVKASGLPSGVKLVQDKATKAYSLSGAPTAASKADKAKPGSYTPSKATLTVTTAGKSSQTYAIHWTVLPLPAWAVGTFDGTAALTVAAKGKISGKVLFGGKTWTLSAPSFDSVWVVDSEKGIPSFSADVICKSGKEVATNSVLVSVENVATLAGSAFERGVAACEDWSAWQNLWKLDDWKAEAKLFANSQLEAGDVSLKIAATGAVTAMHQGYTCASVLVPEGNGEYFVVVSFPPKPAKSYEGLSAVIRLRWDESAKKLSVR